LEWLGGGGGRRRELKEEDLMVLSRKKFYKPLEPKKKIKNKKFYDDYYKINYKGQTHTIPKGPITQARKHQPKKKGRAWIKTAS